MSELNALYIDFNSYFASVEQLLRPELRGKPVAVLPVVAETTCCIAASYEAKAFGVRTGTRVSDARVMCPDIILVEARPALYIEYHHKLIEVVEKISNKQLVFEKLNRNLTDVSKTMADPSKLYKLTGYNPKTEIETGILETFKWASNKNTLAHIQKWIESC